MKAAIPRLRVFIGPNGSGKSTIARQILDRYPSVFINADDIEKSLQDGSFTFDLYELVPNSATLGAFLGDSTQFDLSSVYSVQIENNQVRFQGKIDSYFAASIAEFVRTSLLKQGRDFAFESVFSHDSKLELLETARALGFRIYVYVVCTEDSEINIGRVKDRVSRGGHPVGEAKIRERYVRFLGLLPKAVSHSDRAYFFDNSAENSESAFFAEYDGESATLDWKEEWIPGWFVSSFQHIFPADSSSD